MSTVTKVGAGATALTASAGAASAGKGNKPSKEAKARKKAQRVTEIANRIRENAGEEQRRRFLRNHPHVSLTTNEYKFALNKGDR
jgi:hypothetical protein